MGRFPVPVRRYMSVFSHVCHCGIVIHEAKQKCKLHCIFFNVNCKYVNMTINQINKSKCHYSLVHRELRRRRRRVELRQGKEVFYLCSTAIVVSV